MSNAKRYFVKATRTAPAHWASYWINGDATGFDYSNTPDDPHAGDREQAQADAALASIGLGDPVDCSESEFMSYPDYGQPGDCCTYTFMREQTDADRVRTLADIHGLLSDPSQSAADCYALIAELLADIGMPVPGRDETEFTEDGRIA